MQLALKSGLKWAPLHLGCPLGFPVQFGIAETDPESWTHLAWELVHTSSVRFRNYHSRKIA